MIKFPTFLFLVFQAILIFMLKFGKYHLESRIEELKSLKLMLPIAAVGNSNTLIFYLLFDNFLVIIVKSSLCRKTCPPSQIIKYPPVFGAVTSQKLFCPGQDTL